MERHVSLNHTLPTMNTGVGSPPDSRYDFQAIESAAFANSRSSVPDNPGSQKVITVGSDADTAIIPGSVLRCGHPLFPKRPLLGDHPDAVAMIQFILIPSAYCQ